MFDCLARQAHSARIALWNSPTSSSLDDEKHVASLLLSTARRDPGLIASLAKLAPSNGSFRAERALASEAINAAIRRAVLDSSRVTDDPE